MKLQAPKGTFDLLPNDDSQRHRLVEQTARAVFDRTGYGRIETPVFEDTALFARGIGDSTEIVSKEMYSFEDQGGRSLTLRPEGTASICRAYVEHGMHKDPQPVKLWYSGPFFRQEAPQAGRFRQFFQIGCEALGSDSPAVDAESISLLATLLREAGVSDFRLRLSSLGSTEARAEYVAKLKTFLLANADQLSNEVRERIELNPLRAFDAKHEATQAVMSEAPKLLDHIDDDDARHFAEVRALLDIAEINYEVDPTLVRGLDYYTRTVFEFTSDRLGAQSGLGGGGRYDGLVETLGGSATPAIGWAAGIERILLAAAAETGESPVGAPVTGRGIDVYVVSTGDVEGLLAFAAITKLHDAGIRAQMELAGRSHKGQLKQADRLGARYALIYEGDDVTLRDMKFQTDSRPASPVDELIKQVKDGFAA